jgi:tetratricopeptide (TPR) repeat protein
MSVALSRFDEAREALEAARAIQDHEAEPGSGAALVELRRGRATTLDAAGKVARYRGQLGEADALLRKALGIWRAIGDERGAAQTLHELGVLYLRRADWAMASSLLQQSLDMKRSVGRGGGGGGGAQIPGPHLPSTRATHTYDTH